MKELSAGQVHLVVFVNDRGKPIAVPGHLVVSNGDEIVFHSVDVGPVSLLFPDGIVATVPGGVQVRGAEIQDSRHPTRVYVNLDAVAERGPGLYSYAAYCRDRAIEDFAVGGSQPKIIIYQ